jgi:peptidyl-prolyl cis-trans isomerase C
MGHIVPDLRSRSSKAAMVSVNGVVIDHAAISREVQHHPAPKPIGAWQAAARALVVRELLLQEARRVGLKAEPASDDDGRRETEEEALVRALIDSEVVTPGADDEACRRYYAQNRQMFRTAAIYEAAHILFAARGDDAAAFARAGSEAAAVRAELAVRPERFAELAQLHSSCPSKNQGGNLGQITAGQTTPEFERALTSIAPGTISDPVTTRYGIHIIRLDRKHEGRELPYELVAERIADYLHESVQRRALAQYVARLATAARIEGVDLASAQDMRVN